MNTAYERFRALHERSEAFVMPNAWDGTSAAILKRTGFEALGSGVRDHVVARDGVTPVPAPKRERNSG